MVSPKKHLGQHFLKDKNIAKKIVNSIATDTERLLEIGPGTGILTQFLIEKKYKEFYVIEIDSESVEYLKLNFPGLEGKIINDDFLKYDTGALFSGNFSITGNFPYNISSQILFKIIEYRDRITEVTGMFQKEVAERIASEPGSKKYGILSVLLKAFFDIEYLFTVSETVFYPPPKVKSAVIKLKRNNVEKLDCDENVFFSMVKAGFNQRRKTLRNSLKNFSFSRNEIVTTLLSKRAEQLDVDDFLILVKNVMI